MIEEEVKKESGNYEAWEIIGKIALGFEYWFRQAICNISLGTRNLLSPRSRQLYHSPKVCALKGLVVFLTWVDENASSDFLYYLLALCLLENCKSADDESLPRVKALFMRAAELNTSSRSWLGVAKACTLLGEHDHAEEAILVSISSDSSGWLIL